MKKHFLFLVLLTFVTSVIPMLSNAKSAAVTPQVQGLTFRDNLRTNTSIFTIWQPVVGASEYIHEYSLNGTSDWQVTRIFAANGTDFTVRGLQANTQIFVRVKAVVGGVEGPYSVVTPMRTRNIPARPTDLTGVSSSGNVTLTWRDNSNSETRFLVFASFDGGRSYVAPVVVPASNGTTASFVYGGLPANADIRFYVVAENLDGVSDQSNNILITTVPNKVQFLSAFTVGLNFIGTFWENPNLSPGGFNFQFIQDGSSEWSSVFIPPGAGNSFILSNLLPGTRYLIRISALNSAGSGNFSDPIVVTTLRRLAPNAPTNLKTTRTDVSISSTWTSGLEDQVFFTNTRNFNVAQITRDTTLAPTSVQLDKDSTSYTFTGLLPQTAYYIRIGSGNEVATTFSPWVVDTTLGKPLAPSDLVANAAIDAVSDGIVQLSWKDNSMNEDFFTVTIQGGNAPQTVKVIPNTTQFTHTPVEEGVSYAYFVSAGNEFGMSGTTDTVRVAIPYATVPNAPYGLKATRSGGNVVLTWLDDSNAEESFGIERAPIGTTNFTALGTVGRNIVTFTDPNVASTAGFTYRVRAINPIGASAFSATANVMAAPAATGMVSGDWLVYPNPTANSLRVDLSDLNLSGDYTVRVLDGMNREVLRKSFDAATGTTVDLSSLREGNYTLVVAGAGNRMTKQVVKY